MESVQRKKVLSRMIVTWLLYGATFVVSILSLASTAFPALILRTFGGLEDNLGINPLEPGFYFVPLITVNLSLLCLGLLYHKDKLPNLLKRSIKFIFNFELSATAAFFIIIIVIGFYLVFAVEELSNGKFLPDWSFRGQENLDNFDPLEIGNPGLESILGYFLIGLDYKYLEYLKRFH